MTVTGAPEPNEAFPSEEHHYQHHRDLETGGGAEPSTLSRLGAANVAHNGNASDDDVAIEWTTAGGEVLGDDISLDGDDASIIHFNADGIYAVSAWAKCETSGKFTQVGTLGMDFTPGLPRASAYSTGIFNDADGTFDSVGFSLSVTYFVPAGSTAVLNVFGETFDAGGGAPTWDLPAIGYLYIQRVA